MSLHFAVGRPRSTQGEINLIYEALNKTLMLTPKPLALYHPLAGLDSSVADAQSP